MNKLTSTQLQFIFDNKDKMKQVDIAKALNVTPGTINHKIHNRQFRVKGKVVEGMFDIDREWRKCYGW